MKGLLTKQGGYYDLGNYLNKQPGTYFTYSNANFGIIATVIERVSNIRFDIFVRQKILK